ncbi:MAG: DNA gyrase modulator, partial [Bacillota bacterium]|nr:DNA gyrase modulator [Bacillota bacterium]
MNINTLLERILAYSIKVGADECEIFLSRGEAKRLVIGEGQLRDREIALTNGFSLRLLKNSRIGFSYGNEISEPALKKAVDDALISCDFLAPEPLYGFTPPGASYPALPQYTPDELSFRRELDFVRNMEKKALSAKAIAKVDKAALSLVRAEAVIKNSLGLDLAYDTGYCSCSLLAVAQNSGETEVGGEFMAKKHFDVLKPETVAE